MRESDVDSDGAMPIGRQGGVQRPCPVIGRFSASVRVGPRTGCRNRCRGRHQSRRETQLTRPLLGADCCTSYRRALDVAARLSARGEASASTLASAPPTGHPFRSPPRTPRTTHTRSASGLLEDTGCFVQRCSVPANWLFENLHFTAALVACGEMSRLLPDLGSAPDLPPRSTGQVVLGRSVTRGRRSQPCH